MISRYFKAGNRSSGVVRTVEDYPTTCPTQLATIREDCYKTTLINPSEPCMQHQAKLIPWDQVKRYFSDRTVKITVREGVKRCREVRGPEPCYIGSHTRVKRNMAPATVVSPTPMDNVAVSVAELMSWMTTDNITQLLTHYTNPREDHNIPRRSSLILCKDFQRQYGASADAHDPVCWNPYQF